MFGLRVLMTGTANVVGVEEVESWPTAEQSLLVAD